MKKCKFCQTEIDAKAKVCPNCKRDLRSITNIGSGIVLILVLIIIGFMLSITMGNNPIPTSSNENKNDNTDSKGVFISLEEFNKIQIGMTYEQVVDIIGSGGTVSSESSISNHKIEIITWYGNILGANANVTFQNGKVTGKAQVGLN